LNGFAVPPDSKFLMWPQILKKFGYTNGAFVSAWPLTKRLTKLDAHFDVYDETLNRSYQAINSMRYAEDVAPRAIEWMEKNRKGPFFAWVHLFDPHSPYDFRPDFEPTKATGKPDHTKQRGQESAMANVKAYNSEILYTDHWIGKMVEAIDRMGLKENTLIVVTADHGESLGERGYQGHSHSLYESVVHVPLIFRMPGKVRAGQVVETKVTLLDLAPTILDLTVKEKLAETRLTTDFVGRSLAANMTAGETLPDRTVRFVAFSGQKWLMPGWLAKLWLRNLDFPLKFGYRAGDRKVIWTPAKESMEVFDLDDDPFEAHSGPSDGKRYDDETEQLAKWFKATHLRQGDNRMDARDREALESLGYLQ
jgi:arylsulfatase A-like enzyme